MMFKNVAAKVMVYAFDATTGLPKTGDSANITAYVSKDYGTVTVLADTSATEMDATNAKGYYLFDAAQGETNGDVLMVSGKSTTSNVVVIGAPAVIFTRPTTGWLAPATAGRTLVVDASGLADANVVKVGPTGSGTAQTARDIGASVLLSSGTGAGQLDFTSGVVKANAVQWLGGTIPAVNVTGVPLIDLKYVLGTISPAAAGSVRADAVTGAVGSVTGAVGSVTGLTASDVGAIKTQTDKLTFTVANQIDANVLDWKSATAPAMTGDAFARLGAPAGASVSADIAAVKVDTAAVKAKTDNLPAAPAAVSDIPTSGAVADAVWDEALSGHAVSGSTGEAMSAAGAAGDPWIADLSGYSAGQAGYVVAGLPTALENADALLNRDMSAGTDSGSPTARTVRQALRFLRNKWSLSGTTLTVTKEDDTTASWTATVTTSAGADPISGSDPA